MILPLVFSSPSIDFVAADMMLLAFTVALALFLTICVSY